jgi:DNA-binding Xre family transcriptional regulator
MIVAKPKLRKIIRQRQKTIPDFNQRKLAELAHLPEPAISRFDKQERFDINNLFAIARALHLNVEDLFEVTETDDKKNDV